MNRLDYHVDITNQIERCDGRKGLSGSLPSYSAPATKGDIRYTNALIGSAVIGHTAGALYNHYRDKKQEKADKVNSPRQGAIGDAKDQIMIANQQAQQQQAKQQAQQAQISSIRAQQVAQDMPIMNQQGQQIDVLTQSLKDSQEDNQQLQSQLQEVSEQAQGYQQQAQQAANVINTATVLGNMQSQNPDSPVILAAANAADSQ